MARVSETARVITGEPSDLVSEIQRNAWLLWKSVTESCARQNVHINDEGYYVYKGTFRTHVNRLWPTLDAEARRTFERELYALLRQTGMAKCVHAQKPVVWHVAVTWQSTPAVIVPFTRFRMTSGERRVTAEEAGENLPPAPVTIRKTEKPMPATTDSLQTLIDKRREEAKARRLLTVELLESFNEPLVALEVAAALGVEMSQTRKDLRELEEQGLVHCRPETTDERVARYGGQRPRSVAAMLWSTTTPIPERKTQELVEGVRAVANRDFSALSTREVNWKLCDAFSRMGNSTRFDALSLEKKTGVPSATIRHRLGMLLANGAISKAGHAGQRQQYRMSNRNLVYSLLENEQFIEQGTLQEPESKGETDVKKTAHTEQDIDLLQRAAEILDENERLRGVVLELKAQVTDLEKALEAATAPKVDPKLAERLASWTPSTSV